MQTGLLAARMGVAAVDMLLEGKENVFICERDGEMTSVDIQEAIVTDRMYKSSFTPSIKYPTEALAAYSPEKVEQMKEFCRMREAEVKELLDISEDISNYR